MLINQRKLAEQPAVIREIISALTTSTSEGMAPMSLLGFRAYPRWELDGIGRTEEYPTQIDLWRRPAEDVFLTLRWAQLRPGECEVDFVPEGAFATTDVFAQLKAVLEQQQFHYEGQVTGLETYLFTRRFSIEGNPHEHAAVIFVRPATSSKGGTTTCT